MRRYAHHEPAPADHVRYEVYVFGRYWNMDTVYDDGTRASDVMREGEITVKDVREIHNIEHPHLGFAGVSFIFC